MRTKTENTNPMTLSTHWFEQAWARYLLRKRKLADLACVNTTLLIHATMNAHPSILHVSIKERPGRLLFLLKIDFRTTIDYADIAAKIGRAIEPYKALGVDVDFQFEGATP